MLPLRPYLKRTEFTGRANHHALKRILNLADTTRKLARSRLRFMDLVLDIVHWGRVKNRAVDTLS